LIVAGVGRQCPEEREMESGIRKVSRVYNQKGKGKGG